jgi:hypothetical protein
MIVGQSMARQLSARRVWEYATLQEVPFSEAIQHSILHRCSQPRFRRQIFAPSAVKKGITDVRSSPTLRELGTNFDNCMPPPTFWQQYDEGRFKQFDGSKSA